MYGLLAVLVLATSLQAAPVGDGGFPFGIRWKVNGVEQNFTMDDAPPAPILLEVGNTYELFFQGLPLVGAWSSQPQAGFSLTFDSSDKTQQIHLLARIFNPFSSVSIADQNYSFSPSGWAFNDPWTIGLSVGDGLAWQENAGTLSLTPSGGDLLLTATELVVRTSSSEYKASFVPEPSSLSLLLAGGAVLMAGRRRK